MPSIVAVDESLASFGIDEHFQVLVAAVETWANMMLLLKLPFSGYIALN